MSHFSGENLTIDIFGESHAEEIGMTLSGISKGQSIDLEALQQFLDRRAPGKNSYSTARKESDQPIFESGLENQTTDGSAIRAIIKNENVKTTDYSDFQDIPRPGHADYTAMIKYGLDHPVTGGGQFSGRMTAPFCIAGGICKQLLEKEDIRILSRIASIGNIVDDEPLITSTARKDFPAVNDEIGKQMIDLILQKKEEGDSVGGIIECQVFGLPVGLGGPLFEGMEGRISQLLFSIPAVKGVEFGEGFHAASLTGSENNDCFIFGNGKIRTITNHAGGILGGITNGMALTCKVAIKPTPSINKPQWTLNLMTGEQETLKITGRHDPCIVPRAVPCVEAAVAIALYDAFLSELNEE